MKYQPRPGIEMIEICGTHLLVPDRKASVLCPYTLRLHKLQSMVWSALKRNVSMDIIYQANALLMRKSEEEIRITIDSFLAELCDKGFLIPVEDDEHGTD